MSIQSKLEELGVSYVAAKKYWTSCPKCSDARSKKGTRTLGVSIEKEISLFCLHRGCEWNDKAYKIPTEGDVAEIQGVIATPIASSDELPWIPPSQATYDYVDADGNVLMVITRIEATETRGKIFMPIIKDERGNFISQSCKQKTLFWPGKKDFNRVIVVEGEKAAIALNKVVGDKASVCTWPGGAMGTARGDFDQLEGRTVILWPDNDEVGKSCMTNIAKSLVNSIVKMCDVSHLKESEDAADLTKAQITEILNAAKPLGDPLAEEDYPISDYIKYATEYIPGPKTGWDRVDNCLKMPSNGIVVVSGRSSHGKSTTMVNLCYNFLDTTQDPIYFYTMEMTADELVEKLVNIEMSKKHLSTKYLLGGATIGPALDRFMLLQKQGRLNIIGGMTNLNKIVTRMGQERNSKAIVFVDYMQIVPTQYNFGASRYKEIQDSVYRMKDVANKNKVLFFIGSQLTAGENGPDSDTTRESGDINNVAELQLKIWNKPAAKATNSVKVIRRKGEEDEEVPYYDKVPGDMVLSVTKHRRGKAGDKFGFNLINGCAFEEASVERMAINAEY